jgi:two-component system, OmpR family, sensor histidine kinase PhoQ
VRRAPSVTRRLVIAIAVPLVLFFALTVAVLDNVFRQQAALALRQELEQQIVALVTDAQMDRAGHIEVPSLAPDSRLSRSGSGQFALVRNQHGQMLWHSPSMDDVTLDAGPGMEPGQSTFFYRQVLGGAQLAILSRGLQWEYSAGRSADLTFSVAEDTSAQQARLWQLRRRMVGGFSMLATLLLAALGWQLHRALAPVRRLEQEIGEVESGTRAALSAGYPRELDGVADSLNMLLSSERARIARYRDSLGNLAHGLKTPLAVIRAALSGGGAVGAAVDQEIDRITRIVDHQLQRAAGSGGASLGQVPVLVAPLCAELRSAMLRVHGQKDLQIDLEIEAQAAFLGDAGDLIELLGNLLDNACKWCRSRVQLLARIDAESPLARRLVLIVQDDGPGIAPQNRERVLGRGVRADEHAPGHGLGLAMVSDTVAQYGGELSIDVAELLGGARMNLRLPGRLGGPAAVVA